MRDKKREALVKVCDKAANGLIEAEKAYSKACDVRGNATVIADEADAVCSEAEEASVKAYDNLEAYDKQKVAEMNSENEYDELRRIVKKISTSPAVDMLDEIRQELMKVRPYMCGQIAINKLQEVKNRLREVNNLHDEITEGEKNNELHD